jgi:hypothetical protein
MLMVMVPSTISAKLVHAACQIKMAAALVLFVVDLLSTLLIPPI